MDKGHLAFIACPQCQTKLSACMAAFICDACQHRFRSYKGIPILSTQTISNPKLVLADIPTTILSDPLQSDRDNAAALWERYLDHFIRQASGRANASNLALNLVDETKAAFKFLLNISPGDHILNLGPGADNTTISLARTAKRVTVLDLDLRGLYLVMLKKQFYKLDNVDLLFGGDEKFWPLCDHIFDAIIVQDSLIWSVLNLAAKESDDLRPDKHHTDWLLPFFKEIKRVLKPKGCAYFGIRDHRKPEQARVKLEEMLTWLVDKPQLRDIQEDFLKKCIAVFANNDTFSLTINKSGFTRCESYQTSTYHGMPRDIVSLSPEQGRKRLTNLWRSKMLPKRKSSQKGLQVGHTGFLSDGDQSWIRGMLDDLARACDIPTDALEKKALSISRKGKLVVRLSTGPALDHDLIVKVPFYKSSQIMVENNYHALKRLSEDECLLKKRPELVAAFPVCIHAGTYNGQIYFVEQAIDGRAWKNLSRILSEKLLWQQILGILAHFNQLGHGADAMEGALRKSRQHLETVDLFMRGTSVQERRIWEHIRDRSDSI